MSRMTDTVEDLRRARHSGKRAVEASQKPRASGQVVSWSAKLEARPNRFWTAPVLLLTLMGAVTTQAAASQLVLQAAADVKRSGSNDKSAGLGERSRANVLSEMFAQPDWTTYHTTSQILARLRQIDQSCAQLAYNSVRFSYKKEFSADARGSARLESANAETSASTTRASDDPHENLDPGVETVAILLTSGAKQSIFQRIAREIAFHRKTRVLAVFGEHGRELIGPEVALRLAETVCAHEDPKWDATLLDVEFVIIPVANEHGRGLVERGVDVCSRLNENGVDLNRNFPYQWGKHDATTLLEEEPCGPTPFSEPETRAIDHFVRQFRPHLYLSFHSGDQAVILPYDSSRSPPPLERMQRLRAVADRALGLTFKSNSTVEDSRAGPRESPTASKSAGGGGFVTGSASNVFGYCAFGTATDYVFEVLRVPFVYTIELFGELQAHSDDCVRMFNPKAGVTGNNSYEAVVERGVQLVHAFAASVSERLKLERAAGSSFLESDELLPEDDVDADGDGATPMLISADLRRAGIAHVVISEVEHTWSHMGQMSLAAVFLVVFFGVAVFTKRHIIIHERIDKHK
mmetsp:Transcript_12654/g.34074  ORF Transcript_12654/g.34074 Transcript_12654/m.34074 type:complete len:577 (+) Transcript_12654:14-1744(+)